MKGCLLLLLAILLPFRAPAQNAIGMPGITHYTPRQFAADPQVWDIHQDPQGVLYFANDDGLLTFNGSYWKLYALPNKTAVKALAIDAAGRIYTGGQDELGYFYPDETGSLRYHSLKELIPVHERQFADIWDVVMIRDEVFFRTNEAIFQLKDTVIKTFDAPHQWQLLTMAGGKIFAADRQQGLQVFRGGQWQPACKSMPGMRFTGITGYRRDTLLVATQQHGLYLLHDSTLKAFPVNIPDLVLNVARLDSAHFAIGTMESGCYIIDDKGQVVQQFSRKDGLQNNSIQHIFQDRDQHLWLGLKNGIDFITYHSAVKHIYPDPDNQLTSYTARVVGNTLYIGTSNGLYSTVLHTTQQDLSAAKGVFTTVPSTKGKAWDLVETGRQLLLGHSEGVFQVNGNHATRLLSRPGCWTITAIPGSNDLVVGTYTGLHLLQHNTAQFKDGGAVDGLYESLHYLAPEGNTIWASHPYRGVFKLELSPDHQTIVQERLFTRQDGLPATQNNYVYSLQGRMIVATEKGIYAYNPATKRFAPDPQYAPYFHHNPVQYLTQDSSGNIWFTGAQQVGVVDIHKPAGGKPFSIVYFPEMSGQVPNGNAFIYPYNRENIFIGSNAGLFHLNYSDYLTATRPVSVLISAVKATATRDSLVFGGYAAHELPATLEDARHGPGFPHKWNSFHFEYSSTQYDQHIQYSYQLQGFDNTWSDWSARTEKDYTNLPYGDYTFRVRARNNLGDVSAPVSFPFVIRPAWYQTITAFIIYGCLLAALLYYLLKWQESRLTRRQQQRQEEQERQLYLQQLELDRSEKEIISLQKNQLAAQVDFKNKELATVTMLLVERRTLLSKIREELNKLLKTVQPTVSVEFKALLRMLDNAGKGEDDWEQFAIHFDEVHSNFLSTLKKKYPILSPTDLKLCAYLRINLSSKEIAQLLNISAKSVEVSRYRLRKKLELPTEVNLFDFLLQVTG